MSKKKHSRRRKKKSRRSASSAKPAPVKEQSQVQGQKSQKVQSSPGFKLKQSWIIPVVAVLVAVTGVALVFLLKSSSDREDIHPVVKNSDLNVVLITLDTTRADRLGCYGYSQAKTPNLDFLARNGVRFDNAYCPVPLTLPSHCSILTGTYPTFHNVHNNGTYALTAEHVSMAEVLKSQGFITAAFLASFSVDSRFGLDQGFDMYDDNFSEDTPFKAPNSERKAEEVFARFSLWLEEHHSQHFFTWIHFFDPHLPFHPPDSYMIEFGNRPYDGEIAYMDFYVGEVIQKLREKNVLDKTLIIIAGDHGEGLGEKTEIGHGIFLYDMVMRVPFILYAENHLPRGSVISSRVRLIDIMPTLLEMLNIEGAYPYQGVSLIPYIESRENADLDSYIETYYPRENYGWSELTGLISEEWKYIQAPREELYNLKSDPNEEDNLALTEAGIVARMKKNLEDLVARSAHPGSGRRTPSQEERERLRSLGYVGFTEGNQEGPFADPKDKIDELQMLQRAQSYEFQGNFREAARLYERMLEARPLSSSSYVNLALAQAQLKQFDRTIATLQRGIEKIPDSEILLARLGHTYLVTGKLDEAFATMQQVLDLNPRYFDALTACAVILDNTGQKDEAHNYFKKALAIEPENKYLRVNYARSLATGGKIPQAIQAYSALVQDYPQEYILFQYLGIAYGVAGDYANAIKNLEQAVSLNPTPVAYFNLAVAYKETGKLAEAIRALELYLENPAGEDEASIRSVQAELQNLRTKIK